MRTFLFCFASVLLFAGAQARELVAGHALSMRGLGPIRIGMSIADFRKLGLATKDQFPPQNDPDSKSCNQASLERFQGIRVMFEEGVLTRIQISSGKTKDIHAIGIGSSEQDVKKIYGKRLVIEPNYYDDTRHDMSVSSVDGRFGTLFETDGRKVVGFRSGLNKSVQYLEGCE